jgi:ubiquinol-cytochrome c reductase cytochrome c1 subunit
MIMTGFLLCLPFAYLKTAGFYRNLISVRYEMYAVRDGLYYKNFKSGQNSVRAFNYRGNFWT